MANATSGNKRPREANRAPAPIHRSLIRYQDEHRSRCVLNNQFLKPLFTREHMVKLPWDPRYRRYVIQSGLYGVHKIGHIPTDHALISALVERWRQETHTFHFPVGEMTVTLQDVSVLLGLRAGGDPVCLRTDRDWSSVVERLLGKQVTDRTFRTRSRVAINISWLQKEFAICPQDADPETIKRYARAYLLMLVGSLLFTDHSGDSISAVYLPLFEDLECAGRYSWASAVLAYLYRELCLATDPKRKQFGGSVLLLQLWSWERFPMGRPSNRRNVTAPRIGGGGNNDAFLRPPLGYGWSGYKEFASKVTCRVQDSYRVEIDNLNDGNVKWTPYEDRMHLLPLICRATPHLWRTTAPLIHFWIVEPYKPERVARQFRQYQLIPPPVRDDLYVLRDTRNGSGENWPRVHQRYLQDWGNRAAVCLVERPYEISEHEEYMRWFSRASILFLGSPNGPPNAYNSAKRIRRMAAKIVERYRDATDEETITFARELLHGFQAAIKDLHEPYQYNIFSTFDNAPVRMRA